LSQKLAGVVKDGGGEVLTSCGAEEVLVQGEGARARPIGLRLADGTQVRSNVIVLDVDPRRALTGLLQSSSLGEEFVREMHKLKCSSSAFVLHLVFNKDLRLPERVFLMLPKPRRVRTGSNYMEVDSIILSKERCTIKDKPGCVLLARVNVPNHSYPVFEDAEQNPLLGAELTAMVKEEIAYILPAVKKASKEFVTLPTHFSRLTSNGQGAAYGFAPLSTQWYYRRPGPRLSLPNLYLVGAWSRFGGGMEGAALSGVITARELCGERPYGGAAGMGRGGKAAGREAPAKAKPAKSLSLRGRKKKQEDEADEEE
jgi:phytoene dehydrogenase-like protein